MCRLRARTVGAAQRHSEPKRRRVGRCAAHCDAVHDGVGRRREPPRGVADEFAVVASLRERDIISDEEFDRIQTRPLESSTGWPPSAADLRELIHGALTLCVADSLLCGRKPEPSPLGEALHLFGGRKGSRTHRERGGEVTTPIPERQLCYTCDHFVGDVGNYELVCEAFPEGIPSDFLWGKNWHTRPVEGDHGILYTPMPKCSTCAHFIGAKGNHGMVCEAFAEGIPDGILSGRSPHTSPVEGDNGTQYTPVPTCGTCAHFIGRDEEHDMVCEAFPEGIPDDILLGWSQHTGPVDGDNGIQYQPVPSRAS